MNFLDLIWLIPLFPLAGAAAMLLIGWRLDPQPPSDVALAEGLAENAHHGHPHFAHSRVVISRGPRLATGTHR